jgi:hypothetical protein
MQWPSAMAALFSLLTVNAAVRGAGIGYFLRHSAQLLGSSRLKLIVLAVGMNNAAAKHDRRDKEELHTPSAKKEEDRDW